MQELFDERERAIERQARAQRYFAELERGADPSGAGQLPKTWIDLLQAHLWQRAGIRASFARRRVPAAPWGWIPSFPAPSGEVARAFERVEQLLRSCTVRHYGEAPCADDAEWAFDAFVAGRLATVHSDPDWNRRLVAHGAPNSANFFLFAELAFLCLEVEQAAGFWRGLLTALVPSAHLLARFPDGLRGERPAATPRFGQWEGRLLPVAEIARVRAAYAPTASLPNEDRVSRLLDSFSTVVASALDRTATRIGGELRPIVDPIVVEP